MRVSREVDPSELQPAADPLAYTPVRGPRKRWGLRLFLVFLLLVAGGGAFGWYQYGNRVKTMLGLSRGGDAPLVKADAAPIKIRPESPGGMEVPDRDKLVYQRLQGEGAEGKVERLLPPPETPLPPPQPMADADKPTSGEAGQKPSAPSAPAPVKVAEAPPPPPVPPPADLAVRPRPSVPKQVTEPLPKVPTAAQVEAAKPPAPAPFAPPEPSRPAPATTQKAGSDAPPKAAPGPSPAATQTVAATNQRPPAATGKGYMLQLAAVRQPEQAEKEWQRLQRTHAGLLGDLQISVVKADLGPQKGIFYRLRAGPLPDEATARQRCAGLSEQKVGCLVVRTQD